MPTKKPVDVLQGAPAAPTTPENPPNAECKTKQALLLDLISSERGATLEELTSSTGWLPHTARAAITGLRKRGHDVQRQRVVGSAATPSGAAASERP